MQQRVGLARALALEPQILLMDEPFAALDAQTREFMQIELGRIWAAPGVAVVFVTHSLDEALFLADRIVLMGPRPGTVDEVLPVPLPRPRWGYDFRATPEFIERRAYLWQRIRGMVADQPEFRQRDRRWPAAEPVSAERRRRPACPTARARRGQPAAALAAVAAPPVADQHRPRGGSSPWSSSWSCGTWRRFPPGKLLLPSPLDVCPAFIDDGAHAASC